MVFIALWMTWGILRGHVCAHSIQDCVILDGSGLSDREVARRSNLDPSAMVRIMSRHTWQRDRQLGPGYRQYLATSGIHCLFQGDLEGGRNCIWKDMELPPGRQVNMGIDSCRVNRSLLSSNVSYWNMHSPYFALGNLSWKLQFCAKASFSLLLILLGLSLLMFEQLPAVCWSSNENPINLCQCWVSPGPSWATFPGQGLTLHTRICVNK